jgi:hypothetical protein
VNLALAETDSVDLYYSPQLVQASALLSTEEMPLWILDSGASRHFSGALSDFTALKRWNETRNLRTADGRIVVAEGYGSVTVDNLLIDDV